MKLIERCNTIIKKIKEFNGFTLYEAFQDIVNGEGIYINENNLRNFLIRNNIKINEEDVTQIMFRLDRDNDGKISYEEFQNIFLILNDNSFISSYNNSYNIMDNDYSNIKNNVNEKKSNDDINYNLDNNIENDFNINNYQNLKNNNHNNIDYNKNTKEDINHIRNDNTSNSNVTKKDYNYNYIYKKDINIINEDNNKTNIFYDSLEYSKNQENSIDNNIQDIKSKNYSLIQNKNNNKLYQQFFSKNKKSKISEELDQKLKKIFQIPKEKLLTPLNKKDESNEKSDDLDSPKFSYSKILLYYDYSIH